MPNLNPSRTKLNLRITTTPNPQNRTSQKSKIRNAIKTNPATMKPEGQQHPEQQQAMHSGAGGKGGHIPDDKFKAHFGSSHHFSAKGVIVQGQSQFQYGGYSFQFVDAWPAGWAYTDDCYIDYINGEYFLFDALHPGVQIALVVIL